MNRAAAATHTLGAKDQPIQRRPERRRQPPRGIDPTPWGQRTTERRNHAHAIGLMLAHWRACDMSSCTIFMAIVQ